MTYLPIGSVVTLKDGGRPLMITGRNQTTAADNTFWDYSACLYPEGVMDGDYSIFFQAENMDTVLFVGWVTNAEIQLQALLQA